MIKKPVSLFSITNEELIFLREFLRKLRYTSETFQHLRIDPYRRVSSEYPIHAHKILSLGKFGILFSMFFLGASLSEKSVVKNIGQKTVYLLKQMKILVQNSDQIYSDYMILPYKSFYFLSDFLVRYREGHIETNIRSDVVYPVSTDSIHLLAAVPKGNVRSTLDLGTGCGFHAILLSEKSTKVTAVDINKRALDFCNFNLRMNKISNVTSLFGDLFGPIGQKRFDIIVTNPPSLITQPRLHGEVFRDGGLMGSRLVEKIIRSATNHLTPRGKCTIAMVLYESKISLEDHIRLWVSKNSEPGHFTFLTKLVVDVHQYTWMVCLNTFCGNWGDYTRCIDNTFNSLESASVKKIFYGLLSIRRKKKFRITQKNSYSIFL